MTKEERQTGEMVKDKSRVILVAGLSCAAVGALGAIVGYKTGGFEVWPNAEDLKQCLIYGAGVGVGTGFFTGLLVSSAVREKWWLVAIVGCMLTFFGGCYVGNKQANDLHEWGRMMFQERR